MIEAVLDGLFQGVGRRPEHRLVGQLGRKAHGHHLVDDLAVSGGQLARGGRRCWRGHSRWRCVAKARVDVLHRGQELSARVSHILNGGSER